MIAGRRFALIGTAAAIVWYLCILAFWALQPLTDSVPVGVDYTLTSPKAVSVSVDCNGLFDGASRDDSPLPTLNVQPKDTSPLAFQRDPCALVHGQARIIFILDTAGFAAVIAFSVWLALRWRRASPSQLGTDSGHVSLQAG
jgi:hypothetical protein